MLDVVTIINSAFPKDSLGLRADFIKYTSFIASVAQANSSDEVKSVIESYALPAGSSSIKTYSSFNISINSYLGAFAGHEYIKEIKSVHTLNTWGVAAPVGLCMSSGLPDKCNKFVGAISIFGSVIDLGAIASYRLQNDSTQNIPEIKLENIIAPGGYIILSRLFNTPLALGLGWQYGPQVRKITVNGIESKVNSSRINAFLAVDIPFFTLYNKPRSFF